MKQKLDANIWSKISKNRNILSCSHDDEKEYFGMLVSPWIN